MRFFLWEKTTNKGYILQRGTILGGGSAKIWHVMTFWHRGGGEGNFRQAPYIEYTSRVIWNLIICRKSSWAEKMIICGPAYAVLSRVNPSQNLRIQREGGDCQTLSVTFTLRTSLEDVRGHSNRTSGDVPTGCPAMFFFCIFTWYLWPLCIYMNNVYMSDSCDCITCL